MRKLFTTILILIAVGVFGQVPILRTFGELVSPPITHADDGNVGWHGVGTFNPNLDIRIRWIAPRHFDDGTGTDGIGRNYAFKRADKTGGKIYCDRSRHPWIRCD